jgi:hypothetical protein
MSRWIQAEFRTSLGIEARSLVLERYAYGRTYEAMLDRLV